MCCLFDRNIASSHLHCFCLRLKLYPSCTHILALVCTECERHLSSFSLKRVVTHTVWAIDSLIKTVMIKNKCFWPHTGIDEIFVEHVKRVFSSDKFSADQKPTQRLRCCNDGPRWEVDTAGKGCDFTVQRMSGCLEILCVRAMICLTLVRLLPAHFVLILIEFMALFCVICCAVMVCYGVTLHGQRTAALL